MSSRRKQSNPKPSKREIEESKLSELGDRFPADRIYLRKFGNETLVLAKQRLSAGTVLGTFRGAIQLKESEEEQDKILLKVSRCDGGSPVHVMLENESRWLKLMRNAIVPADANICLRISGADILCTVTKDVNKEVELRVTCRIVDQLTKEDQQAVSEDSAVDDTSPEGMLNFESDQNTSLSGEDMLSNKPERESRSSPAPGSDENDNTCESENDNASNQEVPNSGTKSDGRTRESNSAEGNSTRRKVSLPPVRRHAVEENGIYKCPLCNFLNEDRRIFEKHLQSHRSSSFKRVSSHMTNAQSFCDSCSIQFMSVDTYQVHKRFYCKSRRDKEDPRLSPPTPEHSPLTIPGAFKPSPDTVILRNGALNGAVATPSLIQPQAIYAAISTNPLILLPCSIVSGEGLVAQNGVVSPAGTGLVLQTGTSYPAIVGKQPKKEEILPNRKTSHPVMNFSGSEEVSEHATQLRKRKMSEGDVLNLKKPLRLLEEGYRPKSPMKDPDAPLDLSLKRRKVSDVSCRKPVDNTAVESPILSAESCSSPPRPAGLGHIRSPSSSYSNDSIHCYSSHEAVSLLKQSRVSPSPPSLHAEDKSAVLPPGMPPPKVLKQGNNVCEECNIVFYKYDNYMAHKKHYCAYRRQQLSVLAAAAAAASSSREPSSDDNNSNQSAVHEVAPSADEGNVSVLRRLENGEPYRVVMNKPGHSAFICDACGVKFSSLDTLNAHQTYYCSKRADSVMSKYVKSRSENGESPNSVEPPFVGPEEWKCNYCETTCASYEMIRRHLLTHSELRGFRCLLCGYKGNTLRGMRAHACEHLSESTTSIEEFMASTVISENDALPVSRDSEELSDMDSEASKDQSKHYSPGYSEKTLRDEVQHIEVADKREGSASPDKIQDSSRVKRETRDSSPDERQSESVNPLAFCDVVIKTENDQTSSCDESHHETSVKSEPEPDSDCDNSSRANSESPPMHSISVIRRGPDRPNNRQSSPSSEKNNDSQPTELKYCKSCDISFYHMSNFVAHKKYYCTHPVPNCIQEATTVQ